MAALGAQRRHRVASQGLSPYHPTRPFVGRADIRSSRTQSGNSFARGSSRRELEGEFAGPDLMPKVLPDHQLEISLIITREDRRGPVTAILLCRPVR
jgi:hypothetical protein